LRDEDVLVILIWQNLKKELKAMATKQKFPVKARSANNHERISIQAEIADENDEPAAEPVALAPQAAEHVVAEPVEVKAIAVSVTTTLGASPTFEPPGTIKSDDVLDLSAWPLKTLDLFNENAAAVLDLVAALGKAKSPSDAVELHSRFARERYSALMRRTNEFAELARRFSLEASAPVRVTFSAFMA
jgi:Phasin protein